MNERTRALTTHNCVYSVDRDSVTNAVQAVHGKLPDDDLVELLLDNIKDIQSKRKFAMAAGCETEYGSIERLGGGPFVVRMLQLMWSHTRQQVGWLRMLRVRWAYKARYPTTTTTTTRGD